jgi:hypothetical protein
LLVIFQEMNHVPFADKPADADATDRFAPTPVAQPAREIGPRIGQCALTIT